MNNRNDSQHKRLAASRATDRVRGFVSITSAIEVLTIGLALWCTVAALRLLITPIETDIKKSTESGNLSIQQMALANHGTQLWIQRDRSKLFAVNVSDHHSRCLRSRGDGFTRWDVSRDGKTLLILNDSNDLEITRDNETVVEEWLPLESSQLAALSRDGNIAVRLTNGKDAKCWKLCAAAATSFDFECDQFANRISVNPTGSRLAVTTLAGDAQIYDLNDGSLLRTIHEPTRQIIKSFFTEDGKRLVTIQGSLIAVFDAETGTRTVTFENPKTSTDRNPSYYFQSVAVSPDGKLVAAACLSTGIRIFDMETGTCLQDLPTRPVVYQLSFNITNDVVYVAGADGSLLEWCITEDSVREFNLIGENQNTLTSTR